MKTRAQRRDRSQASKLVCRLLASVDRTIAAVEETKRLRRELDKLAAAMGEATR